MTITLNTEYSEKELAFLNDNNCEILSEIKLPKSLALPTRMFIYGCVYVGEIKDDGKFVWAVLSKFKGKYRWGECYSDLETLEEGF